MPAAVSSDDRVSVLRPPAVPFVEDSAVMGLENRIDDHPRCLNCIFTRKECAVAGHGVAKKPLVGRFLSRLFIRKIKLSLLSDKILTREFYAGSQSNSRVRRESKAEVVRPAIRLHSIVKQLLRRPLQLHQN